MREEINIINANEKEEIQKFWNKKEVNKNFILLLFLKFKLNLIWKLVSLWILIVINHFLFTSLDPDNFGFTGNFVIDYFSMFFIFIFLIFIYLFSHFLKKHILIKTFLKNPKNKDNDLKTNLILELNRNRINDEKINKSFLVNLSLKLDLISFLIVLTTALVTSGFYWVYFSLSSKIIISFYNLILILIEYFGKPNIAYLKLHPIISSLTRVTLYEPKKMKKIKNKKMTFQLKIPKDF